MGIQNIKNATASIYELCHKRDQIYPLYNNEGKIVGMHLPLIDFNLEQEVKDLLGLFLTDYIGDTEFQQNELIRYTFLKYGINESKIYFSKNRIEGLDNQGNWIRVAADENVNLEQANKFPRPVASLLEALFFIFASITLLLVIILFSDVDGIFVFVFACVVNIVLGIHKLSGTFKEFKLLKKIKLKNNTIVEANKESTISDIDSKIDIREIKNWFQNNSNRRQPKIPSEINIDEIKNYNLKDWYHKIFSEPQQAHSTTIKIKIIDKIFSDLSNELKNKFDLDTSSVVEILDVFLSAACPKCRGGVTGEMIAIVTASKSARSVLAVGIDSDIKLKRIIDGNCAFCDSDKFKLLWMGERINSIT